MTSTNGKSADTEGVESLVYPEDDFGASVTPPDVEALADGKHKCVRRNRKKSEE